MTVTPYEDKTPIFTDLLTACLTNTVGNQTKTVCFNDGMGHISVKGFGCHMPHHEYLPE